MKYVYTDEHHITLQALDMSSVYRKRWSLHKFFLGMASDMLLIGNGP